jgi:hypothetical protein
MDQATYGAVPRALALTKVALDDIGETDGTSLAVSTTTTNSNIQC